MNEIKEAIAYFEDAVRESDEIIGDCSPDLQAELIEQKEHFVVAIDALREKAKRQNGRPRLCHCCFNREDYQLFYRGQQMDISCCPFCGENWTAEREDSQPLTLEQLKERIGKAVYIVPSEGENNERGIPCEKAWSLVYEDWNDGFRVETTDTIYRIKLYGKTWLAYDHEPKEAQP